jgi:phosphate:Na+ symporter
MTEMIFKLVGGIGLFLMGMVLLTDGLKAFAGDALRTWLVRFTGTPFKAFGSGTLVTLMVQSSSATTVTVIGFVSAGLLTFPQAVGVVMGASLGTTGTGWIVAVLGLKISLGFYALPLVGAGAFLKLLGRGRSRSLGVALAGFGLIFIGIETLQAGMAGLAGVMQLAKLPAGGLWGHGLAMLVGVLLTVVMQSSSAAVATTLTALHAGTINFEQAASLVIGAAVGTTVTGALAAIGGNVPARRTAFAHVTFNLATGVIAVLLLPVFLRGISLAQEHFGLDPGATSLAAFHTSFIVVGVLIFLPFAHPFAAWIERRLPERGFTLTRHLDASLWHAPTVALEATRRALRELAAELFGAVGARLAGTTPAITAAKPEELSVALDRIQEFFAKIPPVREDEPPSATRVAQLHALDHLARLEAHLHPAPNIQAALAVPRVQPLVARTRAILELSEAGMRGATAADWLPQVEQAAASLAEQRRLERPVVLRETADGSGDPGTALEILDAMRWLDRVGYHTWRVGHYLGPDDPPDAGPRE